MDMTSHWHRIQNAEKEEKEKNTEIKKENLVQEVKILKKCEQELVWRGNAAKQVEGAMSKA